MPERDDRALLMAELQERGVEVAAEERPSLAWHRMIVEGVSPQVVLWDCRLGTPDESMLGVVRKALPGVRFLFLQAIGCEPPPGILSEADLVAKRPISVGELADKLIQLVTKP